MLTLIRKINQYLLERYPVSWNTRLLWMALAAFVIHLLYLIWGYVHFADIRGLHENIYTEYVVFNGPQFVVSIMISVVLLVVWMMYLFKHNALKSFYPQRKWSLFTAFVHYVIIFFLCSAFPLSYIAGYKIFLNTRFDQAVVEDELYHLSKSRVFFLEFPADYFISNRVYPAPYDTLYAFGSVEIDERYPVLRLEDNTTQFYTYTYRDYQKDTFQNMQYSDAYEYADKKEISRVDLGKDSLRVFYVDKFVDLQNKDAAGYYTLYNYSGTELNNTHYRYYRESEVAQLPVDSSWGATSLARNFRPKQAQYNKYVYELLQRNDPAEVRELLSGTLAILSKYSIATNLNLDTWFSLVYHPPLFRVDSFIRDTEYYNEYDYAIAPVEMVSDSTVVVAADQTPSRYTRYQLETSKAFRTLDNIRSLSGWYYMTDAIAILCCIAVGLATLLLVYRVTGLKTLLFTIISTIIISILVGLIVFQVSRWNYEGVYGYESGMLTSLYVVAFVYAGIALVPIVLLDTFKKIVSGIALNITLMGFPYFIWLILLTINTHQEIALHQRYKDTNIPLYLQDTLLDKLSPVIVVLIIILATMLFTYCYTAVIKRWKALPEG